MPHTVRRIGTPPATPEGTHRAVVVIGGGQAGLSMSWWLCRRGVDHVVLEAEGAGHEWHDRMEALAARRHLELYRSLVLAPSARARVRAGIRGCTDGLRQQDPAAGGAPWPSP